MPLSYQRWILGAFYYTWEDTWKFRRQVDTRHAEGVPCRTCSASAHRVWQFTSRKPWQYRKSNYCKFVIWFISDEQHFWARCCQVWQCCCWLNYELILRGKRGWGTTERWLIVWTSWDETYLMSCTSKAQMKVRVALHDGSWQTTCQVDVPDANRLEFWAHRLSSKATRLCFVK